MRVEIVSFQSFMCHIERYRCVKFKHQRNFCSCLTVQAKLESRKNNLAGNSETRHNRHCKGCDRVAKISVKRLW